VFLLCRRDQRTLDGIRLAAVLNKALGRQVAGEPQR
jgi:hypothetical protein